MLARKCYQGKNDPFLLIEKSHNLMTANECPFFLSHLHYPSCHVLRYSKLLSGIMECVLNQWQHAGS